MASQNFEEELKMEAIANSLVKEVQETLPREGVISVSKIMKLMLNEFGTV